MSEKLSLGGKVKHLTLSNAMNIKSNFQSKLVTFQVSPNTHPEHIDISNAWVLEHLVMTPQKKYIKKMKNKYPDLKDVSLKLCQDDVALHIVAEHPSIHF